MITNGWFILLAKIITTAQSDAHSKDPYKRNDTLMFLEDFLEGVNKDGVQIDE